MIPNSNLSKPQTRFRYKRRGHRAQLRDMLFIYSVGVAVGSLRWATITRTLLHTQIRRPTGSKLHMPDGLLNTR